MTSHEEAPTESENTAAGRPEAPPAGPRGWALLFARVAAWLVVPVYDVGVLSNDLLGVVHETVHPEHASLWLRPSKR